MDTIRFPIARGPRVFANCAQLLEIVACQVADQTLSAEHVDHLVAGPRIVLLGIGLQLAAVDELHLPREEPIDQFQDREAFAPDAWRSARVQVVTLDLVRLQKCLPAVRP